MKNLLAITILGMLLLATTTNAQSLNDYILDVSDYQTTEVLIATVDVKPKKKKPIPIVEEEEYVPSYQEPTVIYYYYEPFEISTYYQYYYANRPAYNSTPTTIYITDEKPIIGFDNPVRKIAETYYYPEY